MADISDWVFTRLSTHGGVSAIVAARIYPVRMPQNPTMPVITFQQVAGFPEHAFGADPGIFRATYQVTSWATTFTAARALAMQVKAALRRATGLLAGVTVQNTLMEQELEVYEDGPQRYRVDQDYVISYQEP